MKRPLVLTFFSFLCFSLLGFFVKGHETVLRRELADLSNRGLVIEEMGDTRLEVRDSMTGKLHRFPFESILERREPKYKGLPTLMIDLTSIDTTLYDWKYHYLNTIPVSGEWGFGLLSGDLNQNQRIEVYGLFQDSSGYGTRICELTPSGEWEAAYTYSTQIGVIDNIDDIDLDGHEEVYGLNGDTVYVVEQPTSITFPTVDKFRFRRYHFLAYLIPGHLADMDSDGHKEFVYRGSEPDSLQTSITKTYVARYDSLLNNFTPIWSQQMPLGCSSPECARGQSLGDFDNDNRMEIVTSSFDGNIYVIEHVADDSFSVTWSDSLSVAGRVAWGDVDNNGISELFVGGNQQEQDGYVHMRIFAYESVADNSYEPTFAFDIFPVGYFFVDRYQTQDLDNDGQKELLISFGGGNIVIKGTGEHQYELFYYAPVTSSDGFSAGDVNGDNIPELFVGQYLGGEPIVRQTRVFSLDNTLVGLDRPTVEVGSLGITLSQNYPNPFNPTTTIKYTIPRAGYVRLSVFNLLGQLLAVVSEGNQGAGTHEVEFKSGDIPSGIYFYRIEAGGFVQTRKMVIAK